MNEIKEALERILKDRRNLIEVIDPDKVLPGSIEEDEQLHKLDTNLRLLDQVIHAAQKDLNELDYKYNCKTKDLAKSLTAQVLDQAAVVKSNKFKYIKLLLASEEKEKSDLKADIDLFHGTHKTYSGWRDTYKKTRGHSK